MPPMGRLYTVEGRRLMLHRLGFTDGLGPAVRPLRSEVHTWSVHPKYTFVTTCGVKRSAEQEPLVELLALVAIPGAPLVARDLPLAGQRFEGAKRIVEVGGYAVEVEDFDFAYALYAGDPSKGLHTRVASFREGRIGYRLWAARTGRISPSVEDRYDHDVDELMA